MERSEMIQLRVTPDEKQRIRDIAKANGFSISEYILDVLEKNMDPGIVEEQEETRLLRLLSKPTLRKQIVRMIRDQKSAQELP